MKNWIWSKFVLNGIALFFLLALCAVLQGQAPSATAPARDNQHLHTMKANLTATLGALTLDWQSVLYTEDEQPVARSERLWDMDLTMRAVYHEKEGRRFSEEERQGVTGYIGKFLQFLDLGVLPIGQGMKTQAVEWDLGKQEITVSAMTQLRSLVRFKVNEKGLLREGEAEEGVALSSDVTRALIRFSNWFITYCNDTVEWWDAGEGEPVAPPKERANVR